MRHTIRADYSKNNSVPRAIRADYGENTILCANPMRTVRKKKSAQRKTAGGTG
ncbi:MAG: hypothetical protein II811_03970 [Spirochaetaceae bacterium]|nr:hypothetical protein [Spirochaetaceae bacterium]